MIPDAEIQKALDYLRDNADDAAQARANRVYMEEFRKSLKATLKKESNASSNAAKEDDAYAHKDYLAHLEALKAAVEADERHRFLLSAAGAKIDAWRTQQSYQKAMKL